MKRRTFRLLLLLFLIISGLLILYFIDDAPYKEKAFASLSVLAAGISGYLGIVKHSEPFPKHPSESNLIVGMRELFHSDEKLAIALVQLAVIFQAITIDPNFIGDIKKIFVRS